MPDDPTFENDSVEEDAELEELRQQLAEEEAEKASAEAGDEPDVDDETADEDKVDWGALSDNPVVQTYDKSAGDPTEAAPDYGNVIPQGGITDMRTDQDTEYPDREDRAEAQHLRLYNETHPEAPVEPGDGPDEGQRLKDLSEAPASGQGSRDYIPNAPSADQAPSLQDQIDMGIGSPYPNVERPGYDEDTDPDERTRELTRVERNQAEGNGNPQSLFVVDTESDEATSNLVQVESASPEALEGPRDANPEPYEAN